MATITKRNDSYRIRVSCGYDINGSQITKSITWTPPPGMTKKNLDKELQRQAFIFEEKCRTGQFLDGNIRFAEFADKWFTDHADKQLRATTVAGYRQLLIPIIQAIGHQKIGDIQPHHLMEFYNNLREEGIRRSLKYCSAVDINNLLSERKMTKEALSKKASLSVRTIYAVCSGDNVDKRSAEKVSVALDIKFKELFKPEDDALTTISENTIKHYHALISAILEKAVKWQLIFSNPCERVEPPKAKRKEARYLDEDQTVDLLSYLDGEPLQYRTMITLLLYSGLRRGELCGLEWSDVDFKQNIIDINKASLYLKGKGTFDDETKTHSSQRVIKLPPAVIDLLREHHLEQMKTAIQLSDTWVHSNKLFTQWNGKPIHPNTISNWFALFIKKNNLPDVSIHSLRHTNATLLIAGGTDIRTVSKRLGHAQTSTTTNVYAHAIKSADERAAELLGDILKPSKEKAKKA